MRNGLPPNGDDRAFFSPPNGLRARLIAALLLAGTPAILLGLSEARNNLNASVGRETRLANELGRQITSRLADRFDNSWRALEFASRLEDVAAGGDSCAGVLRELEETADFAAVSRSDAQGRLLCASVEAPRGMPFGETDWFRRVADGDSRVVSNLMVGPISQRTVLLLAVPLRRGETFDGAVAGSISQEDLDRIVAAELPPDRAVFVFDGDSQLVASALGDIPAASAAKAVSEEGARAAPGLRVATFEDPDSGLQVRLISRAPERAAGLAAIVTAAAPLLTVLLGAVAMWLAIEGWVLRHFRALEHKARLFQSGVESQAQLDGAPSELRSLSASLDAAFHQALERERDLERAAVENRRLSRELHHRVKNNLQVLTSLVNRQQKRASEPLVRGAIAEARARMLAVALVHRFIDPPEHLGIIDFDAYLAELARQLHAALSGDARGVRLSLDIEGGETPVDFATVVGLILAEAFVSGYGRAAGFSGAEAIVSWRAADPRALSIAVKSPLGGSDLDTDLLRELARQAGAEISFGEGASVSLAWPEANEAVVEAT